MNNTLKFNLSVSPEQITLIGLGFQALIAQIHATANELNFQLAQQQSIEPKPE